MSEETIHQDVDEQVVDAEESAQDEQPEISLSRRDEVIKGIHAKRRALEAGEPPEVEEAEEVAAEIEEEVEVEETPKPPETVTIVVDGIEQKVELSKVLDHGKRALQKDHTADLRLRRAAEQLREIEDREKRLNEMLKKANKKPDSTVKELREKFGKALVEDENEAAELFAQAIARQEELEERIQSLSEDVTMSKMFVKDQRENAGRRLISLFKREFPELASDPDLSRKANYRTAELKRENPDMTDEDIVIQAGKDVRGYLRSLYGETEVPQAEPDNSPQRVKQRMPKPVKRASARMQPKPEEKKKTTREIIQEMAATRNPYAAR